MHVENDLMLASRSLKTSSSESAGGRGTIMLYPGDKAQFPHHDYLEVVCSGNAKF